MDDTEPPTAKRHKTTMASEIMQDAEEQGVDTNINAVDGGGEESAENTLEFVEQELKKDNLTRDDLSRLLEKCDKFINQLDKSSRPEDKSMRDSFFKKKRSY